MGVGLGLVYRAVHVDENETTAFFYLHHWPPQSNGSTTNRRMGSSAMDPLIWHKVAALSGGLLLLLFLLCFSIFLFTLRISWLSSVIVGWAGVAALGLGTYGAHVFRPQDPVYKQVEHPFSATGRISLSLSPSLILHPIPNLSFLGFSFSQVVSFMIIWW